ncbi:hypothetical protein TNCV_930491 [Trichonephila clavipes]|uniref:Uncharacterized protein n=1 Tax=Trichonephila clavipes TaxID=2585209 RepID=A0A8X6W2F7_TRICX|nr:hypothetical protein TNCV_930491 [Trichonephila clavipes]
MPPGSHRSTNHRHVTQQNEKYPLLSCSTLQTILTWDWGLFYSPNDQKVTPIQGNGSRSLCASKCCSWLRKALLVKLYYKNFVSVIAALRVHRYIKGMRDSNRPITSSALNKLRKLTLQVLWRYLKDVDVLQQSVLLPRQGSRRCNP